MFSGIVETIGTVSEVTINGHNKDFVIQSSLAQKMHIDQSLAHNGVCLTVVNIEGDNYTVTAIDETLQKSNLGQLIPGDKVNLERSMRIDGMLDGHIVQGHVDTTATCVDVTEADGSKYYTFEYNPSKPEFVTVEKGSVCVNGASLTVVNSQTGRFSVAIIPYTEQYTNFHTFDVGTTVNIEFDILGKYILKYIGAYMPAK